MQPIYDLIDVVQGIIRTGRTDTRVPVRAERGDAVDELSGLFNTMLDRINALITAMGQSIDNVAHDLRTPIARLRAIGSARLQSRRSGASSAKRSSAALEESERILSMLNTLMDISEAEAGALALKREPVPLRALLGEAIELYEDVAEQKRIAVSLEAGEDVTVPGARDRLRQVFANLLDNAIKYTPAGGSVRDHRLARARRGGGSLQRHRRRYRRRAPAEDLGAPLSRRPQPFRTRARPGAEPGQGLRDAHGGTVEAASEPGQGSTFTVRLPDFRLKAEATDSPTSREPPTPAPPRPQAPTPSLRPPTPILSPL